jgi:hypothetical protein
MIIKAEEIWKDEENKNKFKDIYCNVELNVCITGHNEDNNKKTGITTSPLSTSETEKLKNIIIENFRDELENIILSAKFN